MDFTRILPLLVLLMVAPPGEGQARASGNRGAASSGIERGEYVEPACQDLSAARRVAASRRGLPTREALGKGVFLVASETLSDPNFSQTVVLLLEYDETGAVGLIINRPTQISLASLLPGEEDLKHRPELVFIGGPVDKSQLFLLLRSASGARQSEEIVDGVYASTSLGTLREILAEESTAAAFQAYAGYSGWGPGQLDAELIRGDWLIAPADSETVFDKAADSIWPELIRKNKGLWVYRTAGDCLRFAIVSRPRNPAAFH
jgi:putative transcriptional regulator